MRYYISRPKKHELDGTIVAGIREADPEAVFVKNLQEADICVFQKGWTRSKLCVADYRLAKEKGIRRQESCFYTDRCAAKTN